MSGSARGVRPTDLLALVSFDGRVFRDEAITWDRLCRAHEPHSAFESALEGMLSFATGRHTWISVDGQRIRALVAGRKRGGPLVWEVDTLLATDEQPLVASGLLQQLARAARAAGAVRVVLRLAADSSALPIAEAAGFAVYRRECRYVRGGAPLAGGGPWADGSASAPRRRFAGALPAVHQPRYRRRCASTKRRRWPNGGLSANAAALATIASSCSKAATARSRHGCGWRAMAAMSG